MKSLVFFGIGIIFLVLQTTMFHRFPAWIGQPDLLFLLLVFVALQLGTFRGLVLTLLLGMMLDIFSGVHLGVYPLAYLLLFSVIKAISRNLALKDSVHQVPLVMVGFLGFAACVHLLVSLLSPENETYWAWPQLLQHIVILGVACLPFFHCCQWLQDLLENKPPLSLFVFKRRPANRFNRV
ncbi:MAG TPA: rod shape-determining protein MreD [Desulfurivibrio alkaliphilus]|uniref:Rod shape-determining protein MreD n=1 Tax=Desulfurivibrio alkaliphilus TaxID=427923 RepID=A0A7C2XFZ6_9BACT|nr:rod shape-determining protein MreD [Desulfurivibrio alkaliphilus]